MIKLAAFDVDGTLRDRDDVPDSTIQALQLLKENGVTLALCTGRSEVEVATLREQLSIDWTVTCNGSHIGYRGGTLLGNPFREDTLQEWLQTAQKHQHSMLLYGAKAFYLFGSDEPHFRQAQREIGFMEPARIEDGQEIPEIYQCILFIGEEQEPYYIPEGRDTYYVHRWRGWAVDVNPGGVNKAIGLSKLLDHLGMKPEEAAAFGDGLNDLELLESVGTGIAMGNGSDELKARAKYVTKPMHENGIAYAVKEWLMTT
ncbi:Cof-type HAD-IIB family hydrolase [Marinicrinis lubricantis]|uniref:Cof-type HAD-IIB family hydrolase n=1 Tax=Marinicrinis lubricantis TaxID=2086470 RepID=A0ABW1IRA6_9BACL